MVPHREHFWNTGPTWPFYALVLLTLVVFGYGIWRRVRHLRGPMPPLSYRSALRGLLGVPLFRGDLGGGTMHLLLAWGFLLLFAGTVLSTVDHWLVSFLNGGIYLIYSVGLEFAGIAFLVGLSWAAVRRVTLPRLENRVQDLGVLGLLAAVGLSGFLVEGLRLAAESPTWGAWSFVGGLVALGFGSGSAEQAYPAAWWIHAALSLAIIAWFPYTKLFHVFAAPLHLGLESAVPAVVPLEDRPEGARATLAFKERLALDACTRCGRCVQACPAFGAGEPFSPLMVLDAARDHLDGPAEAGLLGSATLPWHCTTCRGCQEACPVSIATPELVLEARRAEIETGTRVASHLVQTLERLHKYGNPWESSKKNRSTWLKKLGAPNLVKTGGEGRLCYLVGCTTSLDTRARGMAVALTELLGRAEVDFGTMGGKEPCCGDIARRLGEDGLFEDQAAELVKMLSKGEISELVTSSPHCLNTLSADLPALQDALGEPISLDVRHYTEVLDGLLESGALKLEGRVEARVTWHDPCYLGRHAGMYEAPRRIIRSIPGIELLEMPRSGANSLCCGGGGGRTWLEELDGEEQMAVIRIREAAATGAEILLTGCPLCLVMLTDAARTEGLAEQVEVLDLAELVTRSSD